MFSSSYVRRKLIKNAHLLNALSPIKVINEGIFNWFDDEKPEKAQFSIDNSEDSIFIYFINMLILNYYS